MSAAAEEPDYDVEAAFEAELALLSDTSDTGASIWDVGPEKHLGSLPKAFLTLDDKNDSDDCDSDGEDKGTDGTEPESLQRLRAAVERRQVALEEFSRDMQRVQQEIAVTAASSATSAKATAASTLAAADLVGVQSLAASGAAAVAVTVAEGEQRLAPGTVGYAEGGAATAAKAAPSLGSGPADDRRRLQEEYQAEEAARQAGRERQRQAVEAAAAREAEEAEEHVRRKMEELEKQRQEALAALEVQQAAAAAEAEALRGAAAAERERLAAEQADTAARLEAAAQAAAAREAAREAAMEAFREETLRLARPHLAAKRIARAWRRYLAGPVRATQAAAAVRIQAHWRGFRDRRHAERMRQQRNLTRKLEEMASKGRLEELRAAAEHARDIGLGDALQQRLSALESAAGDTAAKLSAAAEGGSLLAFRAAQAAAQRFPHLAELLARSSEVFNSRRAEAAAAVHAAVEVQPTSEFTRLLESAGSLGVEPQVLTAALEAVRQRDAQLAAQLAAAAAACGGAFDLAAFAVLAERGLQLGLKGDVAAARHTLERRRRALASALQQWGGSCSAAEAAAIAPEAQRLGLQAELEGVQQERRRRQGEMQAALELAAKQASAAQFVAMFRQAERLGIAAAVLQGPQDAFVGRHAAARQALAAGAARGTLRAFLAARCAAVRCGVGLGDLLAADLALQARRREVVPLLAGALRQLCGAAAALPLQPRALLGAVEALGSALGLGDVRGALQRVAAEAGAALPAGTGAFLATQAGMRRPREWEQQLRAAGPSSSSTEEGAWTGGLCRRLGELLRAVWTHSVCSLRLGIPEVVCLALCALRLHCAVSLAEGSYTLRSAEVPLDYWGVPQLPQWLRAAAGSAAGAAQQPAGSGGSAGNELAVRLADVAQRRCGRVRTCCTAINPQTLLDAWRGFLPAPCCQSTKGAASSQQARSAASRQPGVAAAAIPSRPAPEPPPRSPACGPAVPLTRAVILRNAPLSTTSSTASAPSLDRLTRLDLGLERLGSLAGLDVLCPSLRCLAACANQLTSLEGLAGLGRLTELAVKGNQLSELRGGGGGGGSTAAWARKERGGVGSAAGTVWCLPAGGSLRRLALDSNCLSGEFSGLEGCSGLRSLSLADNSLTDLGSGLAACAASLSSLVAYGNCFTSLTGPRCSLAGCTALRCLEVSGNRLTSLKGIQGLVLLQSLSARGNQVAALPRPLCLPFLTHLDLSHNALQAFWGAGDGGGSGSAGGVLLPVLQFLNLSSNRIHRIGPLSPMPHLTSLDLSFNDLPSLASLRPLGALSRLRQLNLGDNPATAPADGGGPVPLRLLPGGATAAPALHRQAVVALLPWLRELDHEEVGERDRARGEVRAVTSSPAAAVAVMRAMRLGNGAAGGLCMPVHQARYPVGSISSAVLQTRHVAGASSSSSKSKGAAPRSTRLHYAAVCPSAAEHMHPAARRCLLSSLATSSQSCTGATAFCVARTAPSYDASLVGRGAQRSETHTAASGPRSGGSAGPSHWLAHAERLWHATSPYDVAEMQLRDLAVVQALAPQGLGDSLGSSGRGGASSKAGGPLPPAQVALACSSATARPAAAAGALLQGGGLLDCAPLRGFRPTARALQWLSRGGAACKTANKGPAAAPSGAAAAVPSGSNSGGGGGVVPPGSVAAEVEARYEAQQAAAWQQMAAELRQVLQSLCGDRGGNGGGSGGALLTAVLSRPSFYWRRMVCDAGAAATTIQAHWRGRRARQLAAELRSDQYQARCRSAASTIQSWWRGHRIRCSSELQQLRAARQREEERRRHAAAVKIQAYFRGHLVRSRLRAAMAAARLGVGGGSEDSDEELLGGSGELGDMLAFLQPLEKLFGEEKAQAKGFGPGTYQQQPAQLQALGLRQQQPLPGYFHAGTGGSEVLQGAARAAAAAPTSPAMLGSVAAGPAGLRPQPPLAWAAPAPALASSPSTMSPGGYAALDPPMSLPLAAGAPMHSPGVLSSSHLSEQQLSARPLNPFATAGALPPLQRVPPVPPPAQLLYGAPGGSGSTTGGGSRPPALAVVEGSCDYSGLDSRWQSGDMGVGAPGSECGAGPSCGTPGSQADSVTPSSQERRQQRHLERLQALLAEWGFRDLATAEAYYRRTLRQKQGQTRKKLEDKYRNPAQRLQKLQQQVEARQGQSPAVRPPLHDQAGLHASPPALVPPAAPPLHQLSGRPPLPLEQGRRPRGPGRPATVRSDSGGDTEASPLRNVSSADGILTGAAGGSGGMPAVALPALVHRRDSEGGSSPLLGPPRTGGSGGYAAAGGAASSRVHSGGGGVDDEDWLSVLSFGSVGREAGREGARGADGRKPWGGGLHGAAAQSQAHPRGRPLLPALANNWMTAPPSQTPLHAAGENLQRRPMGPGRSPG